MNGRKNVNVKYILFFSFQLQCLTSSMVELKVEVKHRLTNPVVLKEGVSLNITCEVLSRLSNPGMFHWLYTEPNVYGDADPRVILEGRTLTLVDLHPRQSGDYTCVAVG